MKEKHLDQIEQFVANLDHLVGELENYSQYLQMNPQTEQLKNEAFSILNKKLKKMKKAEDVDELKEVLRVRKLLEKRVR